MKITIPESINDITLGAFQKYHELLQREDLQQFDFDKRKIEIFTALKREDISNIKQSDFKFIIEKIDIALEQNVEFEPTFKIKDVEFGFIPNLDKISTGEFVDLRKYDVGVETLHNLMAILFRPILKKDSFNNYKIIDYKGTEQYANIMKQMPLSKVNGALVFFWNLARESTNYTQKYMEEVQVRESKRRSTSKSGDGMQ